MILDRAPSDRRRSVGADLHNHPRDDRRLVGALEPVVELGDHFGCFGLDDSMGRWRTT